MKKYILGDCMEHLVNYKDNHFDLAVVDPPYGIKRSGHKEQKNNYWKGFEFKEWDSKTPTKQYFKQLFRVSKNQIIWGANYFTKFLPKSMGWIVWDKGQKLTMSDGELCYSSFNRALRIYTLNRCKIKENGGTMHPTQKPVALYRWILQNYAKKNDLILDTHVGSASSLIACEIEGFDYVGFEKDEDYFRDSTKRLQQHLSQIRMF